MPQGILMYVIRNGYKSSVDRHGQKVTKGLIPLVDVSLVDVSLIDVPLVDVPNNRQWKAVGFRCLCLRDSRPFFFGPFA